MEGSPPTTIILPTTKWTTSCEEIIDQLDPSDELLLVTDDGSDSIANRRDDLQKGVKLVFAGEPTGCSGKANAIAAGMEVARHDRIVWTDDDFHHPTNWLSQLHADYERHGPVTEVPFFVGRDPLAVLLEPIYAVGGTLGTFTGDIAWGGAVMFELPDLDVESFLQDLRRTISDDGILTEYLEVTALRRTRLVPTGGTLRQSIERHVRFTQIVRWHDPKGLIAMSIVATLSTIAAILYPLPAFVLLTFLQLTIYAAFGIRRWTFLLAYLATILQVPLLLYGIGRRTFVWGGRRYRWRAKFNVEIVG